MSDAASIPLKVRFDSAVKLTIHDAHLTTPGVLLADCVARVHVATMKLLQGTAAAASSPGSSSALTTITSAGGKDKKKETRVMLQLREVAKSKPRYFTSHPTFDETFQFTVSEGCRQGNPTPTAASAAGPQRKSMPVVPPSSHESVVDYIVLTIESVDGSKFYGEAYAPFSPHCSSTAAASTPVRAMLLPRHSQDSTDPLFLQDNATLAERHLDDFGHVSLSWEVTVIPHGGALMTAPSPAALPPSSSPLPSTLALRAVWLARSASYTRGAHYTTSVEFGGPDRFLFRGVEPLCLTLNNGGQPDAALQLRRAIFHCSVQSVVQPDSSRDIAVPLPLPPFAVAEALDRDIHWTTPVRASDGADLGLLLVSIRVARRPLNTNPPPCTQQPCPSINAPTHQEECGHVIQLWPGKTKQPDTPPGPYHPLVWESDDHVAAATRRTWRRQCVMDAQPTAEHVRHIFDVLMGRSALDGGVARVAAAFSNKSPAELTASDLRELLISLAFHSRGVSAEEAARFCFVALRRDVEDAVAVDELLFIVEHCLLPKTVEMPQEELHRWVRDIVGRDTKAVSYEDFVRYFLHNYSMWAAFGVPIAVDECTSSSQREHAMRSTSEPGRVLQVVGTAPPPLASRSASPNPTKQVKVVAQEGTNIVHRAASAPTKVTGPVGATPASTSLLPQESNAWRTFVVRLASAPQKGFSVTAHVNDSISDVMTMIENSTGVKAGKQEWRLSGMDKAPPLDPTATVGSTTLGLSSALKYTAGGGVDSGAVAQRINNGVTQEVIIHEQEENVVLRFHVKEGLQRNRKDWRERVIVKEKVIQLRAAVQRKTLIPLSRCVLRVKRGDGSMVVLQDRHTIAHYHLSSGDTVEVSHE